MVKLSVMLAVACFFTCVITPVKVFANQEETLRGYTGIELQKLKNERDALKEKIRREKFKTQPVATSPDDPTDYEKVRNEANANIVKWGDDLDRLNQRIDALQKDHDKANADFQRNQAATRRREASLSRSRGSRRSNGGGSSSRDSDNHNRMDALRSGHDPAPDSNGGSAAGASVGSTADSAMQGPVTEVPYVSAGEFLKSSKDRKFVAAYQAWLKQPESKRDGVQKTPGMTDAERFLIYHHEHSMQTKAWYASYQKQHKKNPEKYPDNMCFKAGDKPVSADALRIPGGNLKGKSDFLSDAEAQAFIDFNKNYNEPNQSIDGSLPELWNPRDLDHPEVLQDNERCCDWSANLGPVKNETSPANGDPELFQRDPNETRDPDFVCYLSSTDASGKVEKTKGHWEPENLPSQPYDHFDKKDQKSGAFCVYGAPNAKGEHQHGRRWRCVAGDYKAPKFKNPDDEATDAQAVACGILDTIASSWQNLGGVEGDDSCKPDPIYSVPNFEGIGAQNEIKDGKAFKWIERGCRRGRKLDDDSAKRISKSFDACVDVYSVGVKDLAPSDIYQTYVKNKKPESFNPKDDKLKDDSQADRMTKFLSQEGAAKTASPHAGLSRMYRAVYCCLQYSQLVNSKTPRDQVSKEMASFCPQHGGAVDPVEQRSLFDNLEKMARPKMCSEGTEVPPPVKGSSSNATDPADCKVAWDSYVKSFNSCVSSISPERMGKESLERCLFHAKTDCIVDFSDYKRKQIGGGSVARFWGVCDGSMDPHYVAPAQKYSNYVKHWKFVEGWETNRRKQVSVDMRDPVPTDTVPAVVKETAKQSQGKN